MNFKKVFLTLTNKSDLFFQRNHFYYIRPKKKQSLPFQIQ